MSLNAYIKAKKLGEASYREHISVGVDPYLPVLEDVTKDKTIVSEIRLGNQDIPMDRIVGTFTTGRRQAFAHNFMPLLGENSEFGEKWSTLYDSMAKEGLKFPIQAYEYMNYYYVIEGNKRVSVMKFLGAATIPGRVIRLVPQRDETKQNRVYFEHLDFIRHCPQTYLFFSEPGAYKRFLNLIHVDQEHNWTEDERADLKALYFRFESAFKTLDTSITNRIKPADAFLVYLDFYDYQESLDKTPPVITEELKAMQEELLMKPQDNEINLKLDEDQAPKKNGLLGLLSSPGTGSRVLKVDFIHDNTIRNSSWTYNHELGRMHVNSYFGDKVVTRSFFSVKPGEEVEELLAKCAEEGADIVFATSRLFLDAMLSAAVRHPKTRFLCCTLNAAHRYVRTYYARLYEVKLLSGIIAGACSKDDNIGYLSDLPVPSHLANVNAFATGVKMVRPQAKIHLQWLHEKGTDALNYFADHNITTISGRDMKNLSAPKMDYGLYQWIDGKRKDLAMTSVNWGIIYQKIIESVRSGAYEEAEQYAEGRSTLNYWWGIPSDAVELFYSRNVPFDTVRLSNLLKESIKYGAFDIFSWSTQGKADLDLNGRIAALQPDEIMKIDWLMENIVGHIPSRENMTEYGKALMAAYDE